MNCIIHCMHENDGHCTRDEGKGVKVNVYIKESVNSSCRDGTDTPMPPYIGKACTRTNIEDLKI